jgi:hypothetical protein
VFRFSEFFAIEKGLWRQRSSRRDEHGGEHLFEEDPELQHLRKKE